MFTQLERASFGGVEFPIKKHAIIGGNVDGMRKTMVIKMDAVFDQTIEGYGVDLWPARLTALLDLFEDGTTKELVVPHAGTIKAMAMEWTEETSLDVRRASNLHVVFHEDLQANMAST